MPALIRYLALVDTVLPFPHGRGEIRYFSNISITELGAIVSFRHSGFCLLELVWLLQAKWGEIQNSTKLFINMKHLVDEMCQSTAKPWLMAHLKDATLLMSLTCECNTHNLSQCDSYPQSSISTAIGKNDHLPKHEEFDINKGMLLLARQFTDLADWYHLQMSSNTGQAC